MVQTEISLETPGRGIHDITAEVAGIVSKAQLPVGLCHLFICHTSASLVITENADPDVHRDLGTFLGDLVPDGDERYAHRSEGPDDMAAHVRSVLTQTHLTIPVRDGRLILGTWQGIYVWEHRMQSQRRRVVVTVHGA